MFETSSNMQSLASSIDFEQIVLIGVQLIGKRRMKVIKGYLRVEELIKASHFLGKDSVHTLFIKNWIFELNGLYVKVRW
jgi:hypothetical protein